MKNNKNDNKIIIYIIVFFVGCLVMYGLMQKLSTPTTKHITKLEKDVTVTDKGIADAVEKVYDAVVVVATYKNDQFIASGTGFVYKNEKNKYSLLTNYHVIEGGNRVVVTFTNGIIKEVKVIGYNEYADIAVLRLESKEELKVAKIGNSNKMRVGDTTFAVGAPIDSAYSWTVTRGILSGKDRLVEVSLNNNNVFGNITSDYVMKVIQTDTAINSGNSGGPLCNANGEVIGITSLKLVSSGIESMGFAIPIEDALSKAKEIESGVVGAFPYLGIVITNYNLIRDNDIINGVIVTHVEKNSAAEKGGIKANDIIIKMDNDKIKNVAYLHYYLYKHNIGDKVTITVIRDGKEKTLDITLKGQVTS